MTSRLFSKLSLARRIMDQGEVDLAAEVCMVALSETSQAGLDRAGQLAKAAELIQADDISGADNVLNNMNQDAQDAARDNDREALKHDVKDTLEGTGEALKAPQAGLPEMPQASVLPIAAWLIDHAGKVAAVHEGAAQSLAKAAQSIVEVA